MQKKLIALAAVAAFSAPAFADNSNVTVYGKLNLDMENIQNDKAAGVRSVNRVQSNASRFGVKGSEDLGEGLSAIWQLEAQVDANGAVGNGFGNGTRNSQIGLKGDFGTAFYGVWDTPFKNAHNKNELFDNAGSFTSTQLIGRATPTGADNYVTRQPSDFQYWTPKLNGFVGKISYAPDTQTAAVTAKKNRVSLSGEYENDMLYAALAYESRSADLAPAVNDAVTRLVGTYKFDAGQIGLTYDRMSVAATATSTVAGTQNNWELMGSYKFGNSTLGASYVKNGSLSTAALPNNGAKMATLRYGYNFSKRTELYAAYTSLKNDTNGNYAITANKVGTTGAKQSGLGLGMIHSF